MSEQEPQAPAARGKTARVVLATVVALAFSLGVYAYLEGARPSRGLISVAFLLVLPAAISGFVAYVADLPGKRSIRAYLAVPLWILLAAIVAAIIFLHEGAICIIMLAPLWLISGLVGAALTYIVRERLRRGRTYCIAILAAPLVAMQVEPYFPPSWETAVVTRTIEVEAPPERIWPLLRGIPDVKPHEGRWNLTQDVIGVPRPLGARLDGQGVGAARYASWSRDVAFREEIIAWQAERRLSWKFVFDREDNWDMTDRHLRPDSAYLQILSGGYALEPLGPTRTRITLHTAYRMRTPVNGYSALWGELFLGDLETNLLALVRQRAEASPPPKS